MKLKKAKKIINGVIALCVAQLPLLFPNDVTMMAVFVIGLLSILVATYCVLELINN